MTLSVRCPGCGKTLKGSDALAGKPVKCPRCKHAFVVPAHDTADQPSNAAASKFSKSSHGGSSSENANSPASSVPRYDCHEGRGQRGVASPEEGRSQASSVGASTEGSHDAAGVLGVRRFRWPSSVVVSRKALTYAALVLSIASTIAVCLALWTAGWTSHPLATGGVHLTVEDERDGEKMLVANLASTRNGQVTRAFQLKYKISADAVNTDAATGEVTFNPLSKQYTTLLLSFNSRIGADSYRVVVGDERGLEIRRLDTGKYEVCGSAARRFRGIYDNVFWSDEPYMVELRDGSQYEQSERLAVYKQLPDGNETLTFLTNRKCLFHSVRVVNDEIEYRNEEIIVGVVEAYLPTTLAGGVLVFALVGGSFFLLKYTRKRTRPTVTPVHGS
jgi:phage FluMu protein Com